MNEKIKEFRLKFLAAMILVLAFLLAYVYSNAGTVITATNTYNGADEASFPPTALPVAGVYYFDMVVAATPTATSAITSFSAYIQQQGIAGGSYYTLPNSTFTTCNSACTQTVVPDVYEGGNVRLRWTVTSGSATVKATARQVSP